MRGIRIPRLNDRLVGFVHVSTVGGLVHIGEFLNADIPVVAQVFAGGIILLQHNLGLGTLQQQLVGGERTLEDMGIANLGNLVGELKLFADLTRAVTVVGGAGTEHAGNTGQRTDVVTAPESVAATGDEEYLTGGRTGAGIAVAHGATGQHRVGGDEQQVVVLGGILPCIGKVIAIVGISQWGVVEHHVLERAIVGAQYGIGVLDSFLPFTLVEVETGGKGMGGFVVEVPFRLLENLLIKVGKAFFQVGLNLVVDLGNVAAVVFLLHHVLGDGDVGHANVVLAGLSILVGLAENAYQAKVVVGTDEQGLGTGGLQTGRHARGVVGTLVLLCHFVNGLKNSIHRGHAAVVSFPYLTRLVAVGVSGHRGGLKLEELVVGTVIGGVIVVGEDLRVPTLRRQVRCLVVDEVVARQLAYPHIVAPRIRTGQQFDDLVLRVDFSTVVSRMVEETLAA